MEIHKSHTKLLGFLFVLLFVSSASAWYETYESRQEIECTNLVGYPIIINGSSGWNSQYIWINCSEATMYLYYDDNTNYTLTNSTDSLVPYDIEFGNVVSVTPSLVWGSGILGIRHLTNLSDSSGEGHHLTTTGTVLQTTGEIYNGSFLAGSDDYLSTTGYNPTPSYSLTAWLNITDDADEYILEARGDHADGGIFIVAEGDDDLVMGVNDGVWQNCVWTDGMIPYWGSFHYFGFTNDGSKTRFFIDGKLNYTCDNIDSPTGDLAAFKHDFGINDLGASDFTGSFDELREYSKNITAEEMNATYQNMIGTTGYGSLGDVVNQYYTSYTETYNTSGLEGTTQTFTLEIGGINGIDANANFTWNGTVYTNPSKTNISNNYSFSKNITMPSISSNTNVQFNWTFTINNTTTTLSTRNFTIYNILISNCSVGTDGRVLQVNSFNESDLTTVTTDVSAIFYLTIDEEEIIQTSTSENNTTHYFCVTPTNSSLTLDVDLGYIDINAGTLQREYYLCNLNVSNTTPYNASIYSLDTSTGTNTELSVINVTSGEEDVVIRIMRWYQIIGAWSTVTMVKTGFDGVTVVDLEHEGPFYKFQLHKNCGYIQEIGKMQITSTSLSPFVIENDPLMFSYGPYISWECNNTTTHLFCSVSNTQGWDLTPCLDVYNVRANLTELQTLNNSNCGSASSSTTVTVEFGNLTNRIINWQLNVTVQGSIIVLGQGSLVGDTTNPLDNGTTNWFFFIILFFGVVGLNIKHPNQAVMSAMLVTTLSGVVGLIPLAPSTIISLICLGLLVIGEGEK